MTFYPEWMITTGGFRRVVEESPERVVCLDTETTGLNPEKDGIISLSIVDLDGNVLFDSLIHTYRRRSWPDAYRVNHISPRDVRDAPSIPQIRDEVESILSEAEIVVGYNHVRFDLPMMESNGFTIPEVGLFDVMNRYINVRGFDVKRRLSDCARHLGVPFGDGGNTLHSSLGDARVTMECALRLVFDDRTVPDAHSAEGVSA